MDEAKFNRLLDEVMFLRQENCQLRDRITHLEDENARLRQQVLLLREQLEQAQTQAARQAAPFRREERAKIPSDQKKRSGRKAGHPGSFRPIPPQIDQIAEVPLDCCPHCGSTEIEGVVPVEQIIEEIAPIHPHTVKITTYRGHCRRCGRDIHSHHPLQTSQATGCAKVQLGPRALALAACLNKGHGLTMRTTCRVLRDMAGLTLTAGGLSHALYRISQRVGDHYDQIIQHIRGSPAVFADETSWWVGNPGWWLWVFTNANHTLYWVDRRRGAAVVDEVLGERFAGMLVSDCLSSYDPADCAKHKCIAHHFRAIAKAMKLPGMGNPTYLMEWKRFFTAVIALYKLRAILPQEEFAQKRQHMEQWRDRLLETPAGQPGDEAVRFRLAKQRLHLLGCLYEPQAEPTNNRAERALRPAVIARKLSCGNKTLRGRDCWQILASLSTTCRQQAVNFVDFLAEKLPLPC